MSEAVNRHPSSYRDPSGFLFYKSGTLYRQVNQSYWEDYELFISGGLYQQLLNLELLIPHETIQENLTGLPEYYLTLKPEIISFISYPSEWCFDILKDAALATIQAAKEAMKYGMMLKDASAYNLQWHQGKMKFIDTLSFEKYEENKPWIAYRQFCEQFLAPLALMHYLNEPLNRIFLAYPEGVPLSLTHKMLPFKSRLNLHVYLNLHLHGKIAEKNSVNTTPSKPFSAQKLANLFRSLEEAVRSFSYDQKKGTWSNYYEEAFERKDYIQPKKEIVNEWIGKLQFNSALDAGANEGEFSEMLAKKAKSVLSADFEHSAINQLYKKIKEKNLSVITPLVMDLSNPTPATGVNLEERTSFMNRAQTDLVLALALVHHLAIGKNIPFENIAKMFRKLGRQLIIEFVPRDDEKIKLMISQKKDIYQWYSMENFLKGFSKYFQVTDEKEIGDSKRILYLMQGYE